MALQSLFVVNKAGSLIFYRKFSESSPAVSPNDQLHLASTFHGYDSCIPCRCCFGQQVPLADENGGLFSFCDRRDDTEQAVVVAGSR